MKIIELEIHTYPDPHFTARLDAGDYPGYFIWKLTGAELNSVVAAGDHVCVAPDGGSFLREGVGIRVLRESPWVKDFIAGLLRHSRKKS